MIGPFIDLFSGIGGMRLGVGKLGRRVFSCEWDRYAKRSHCLPKVCSISQP